MADTTADIEVTDTSTGTTWKIPGIALFSMLLLAMSMAGNPSSVETVQWAPDCSGDVYALEGAPLLPTAA